MDVIPCLKMCRNVYASFMSLVQEADCSLMNKTEQRSFLRLQTQNTWQPWQRTNTGNIGVTQKTYKKHSDTHRNAHVYPCGYRNIKDRGVGLTTMEMSIMINQITLYMKQ